MGERLGVAVFDRPIRTFEELAQPGHARSRCIVSAIAHDAGIDGKSAALAGPNRGKRSGCGKPARKYAIARAARLAQSRRRMAAVFCLVFLPALAALGFMIKTVQGELSIATGFAAVIFAVLAAFVFGGALGLIKRAEDEPA